MWQKASCNADKFVKDRRYLPFHPRSILVHTRMATQGSPAFPENNHPVRRGSVYIVHNGHVMNDWEIFKKVNRERFGQVDSEAIAAVIAKYGIMQTHKAMEEITGAAAIGVVDETRPGLMALARGSSSPLMFYRNENIAVFGSTVESVRQAWATIYGSAPKEKHIESIPEGTALYLDDTVTRKNFIPDDYFYYGGHMYKQTNYSRNDWKKWQDVEDELDDKDINMDITSSTFIMTETGELEEFFCRHGCRKTDCVICMPYDDIVNGQATLLDDEVCEVCGEIKKIHEVDVGEATPWLICDDCTRELSLELSESEMTRSIHSLTDAELAKL